MSPPPRTAEAGGEPIESRPTHSGVGLVLLTGFVTLAAMNTGANLLFFVLGMVLVSGTVSWWIGRGQLETLRVTVDLPALVEFGRPCPVSVRLSGRGGASVRVEGTSFLTAGGVFFDAERNPAVASFVAVPPRRGVVRVIDLVLISGWPLGLWERRRRLSLAVLVHVHPALPTPRPVVSSVTSGSERDAAGAGDGGSLRQLRPYQVGDSLRTVHWRTTARLGQVFVRQDHDLASPKVRIVVGPNAGNGDIEQQLSLAAGGARDALQAGAEVELRVGSAEIHAASRADLGRVLRFLAEVPGAW